MYKFCYDYVILKYGENAKVCYINTNNFIVFIKQETFT